jgi:putative PIN family toxin of toxin-antitoxin system
MIRVVFDTSVMISALLWEGLPNKLLGLVKLGGIRLHTSFKILVELEEVLDRKKFRERIQRLGTTVDELVKGVETIMEIYSIEDEPKVIKEDPEDNKFLACAVSTGANYIISGDKHLLNLASYQGVGILTPRRFYEKVLGEGFQRS